MTHLGENRKKLHAIGDPNLPPTDFFLTENWNDTDNGIRLLLPPWIGSSAAESLLTLRRVLPSTHRRRRNRRLETLWRATIGMPLQRRWDIEGPA